MVEATTINGKRALVLGDEISLWQGVFADLSSTDMSKHNTEIAGNSMSLGSDIVLVMLAIRVAAQTRGVPIDEVLDRINDEIHGLRDKQHGTHIEDFYAEGGK